MRGQANSTGVKPADGTFELLPNGEYLFEIDSMKETETRHGDPMASIALKIAQGEYKGRFVYDNIVIPREGSPSFKIMGRTKHFLHCIAEPYEDLFEYDTARWLFKRVKAVVKTETQTEGQYAGRSRNVIASYILDEAMQSAGVSSPDDIPWEE
jgi:hypothetical protein